MALSFFDAAPFFAVVEGFFADAFFIAATGFFAVFTALFFEVATAFAIRNSHH